MTSKNAVDNYFRICNEMRVIVPETMKYFCISEATAYYLQKYIQFRKRKIFYSNFSFADLVEIIKKKHKEEKFLLPCTDAPNDEYTDMLDKEGIRYVKATLYKAVYSNLTDINMSQYDLLVLFSSAGITSLLNNFPDFKQGHTLIAAFGEQTAKAVINAGLKLHIHAPQPQAPSMAMALEQFLRGEQKGGKVEWQPTSLSIANVEEMTPPKKMPPKRNRPVEKPKAVVAPIIEKKPEPVVKPAKKAVEKPKPAAKKPAKPVAKKAKPAPKKAVKAVAKKKAKPAPKKKAKPVAKKVAKKVSAKKKPAKRKR